MLVIEVGTADQTAHLTSTRVDVSKVGMIVLVVLEREELVATSKTSGVQL